MHPGSTRHARTNRHCLLIVTVGSIQIMARAVTKLSMCINRLSVHKLVWSPVLGEVLYLVIEEENGHVCFSEAMCEERIVVMFLELSCNGWLF